MGRKESELYKPIKKALETEFERPVYLEITGPGSYSNKIQESIPSSREMIFEVMNRGSSPDLTGYITHGVAAFLLSHPRRDLPEYSEAAYVPDFIVVEIKDEQLANLEPVYQCQRYIDLFNARHGFVITPEPVPEKIKRLCEITGVLDQEPDSHLTLAKYDEQKERVMNWHPENPFDKDLYWTIYRDSHSNP